MRFKQNSAFVRPLCVIWGVLLIIVLFIAILAFDQGDPTAFILAVIVGFGYLLLVMYAMLRNPEGRRTVTLGEWGVSIEAAAPAPLTVRIPWSFAKHVIFTRKGGNNTVILVDGQGTVIWFYSSMKAKKYVRSCCAANGIVIEERKERDLEVRGYYLDFDRQTAAAPRK